MVNRPRSRHLALRWFRVHDAAASLVFAPTNLQRADPLTKTECSNEARRFVLHVAKEPTKEVVADLC